MMSPQGRDEMEFEVTFMGSQSNRTLILLKGTEASLYDM